MRSVLAWMSASTVALTGCANSVQGVDQAGRTALAIDAAGCPNLSGIYAFSVPDEKGVSYKNSMLEQLAIDQYHWVRPSDISGLHIRRNASGAFQFRFVIDDTSVAKDLQVIREFDKPRYRDWYHLQQEPARSADIARNGEAAHVTHVNALGPTTEIVRDVRAGADVSCRNGWMELPRGEYSAPIRLTLGEDGSILGTSREVSTFGVSVWCGDGCKYLGIPTGTYTGTLRWPRDDGQRPWNANTQPLERPLDDVAAELAASTAAQQRADAAHFLPVEQIRARIQELTPDGSVLGRVAVYDGKVWLSYAAPRNSAETLLNRITTAGADTTDGGPQAVRRIVNSAHMDELEVEFVLTESPLVLRTSANPPTAHTTRIIDASDRAAADTVAPANGAPVVVAPGSAAIASERSHPNAAMAETSVTPSSLPPAGYADAREVQRRVGDSFASGCHVSHVRYEGKRTIVSGQADSHRCVSDSLRALDGKGAHPELLDIIDMSDGSSTFRIALIDTDVTKQ